MVFAGIAKSSLIDFPGLLACVLFVPGCNYNCFYCHNRALLDCSTPPLAPEYIEEFLQSRRDRLDGVVISGGEPTLWPDLLPFARKVKEMGYKLKLDTNGSSPDTVRRALEKGAFDYYAVDYKAPAARYEEICGEGADASAVRETIGLLAASGVNFEVRTTVIPQLNASDLVRMAKELPPLPRYVLNKYRRPDKFPPRDRARIDSPPYTPSQIKELAEIVRPYQPNVTT
jgi:pyruvate formate lyase activating enzyme